MENLKIRQAIVDKQSFINGIANFINVYANIEAVSQNEEQANSANIALQGAISSLRAAADEMCKQGTEFIYNNPEFAVVKPIQETEVQENE